MFKRRFISNHVKGCSKFETVRRYGLGSSATLRLGPRPVEQQQHIDYVRATNDCFQHRERTLMSTIFPRDTLYRTLQQ